MSIDSCRRANVRPIGRSRALRSKTLCWPLPAVDYWRSQVAATQKLGATDVNVLTLGAPRSCEHAWRDARASHYWHRCGAMRDRHTASRPIRDALDGSFGARRPVPAAKAERPL